ncbi:ino eighty subunit 1 [Sporormia fimetaria CBS 119925]|uniref:Ino eighty subunit 1 n=1 Tax=Sporormia fimetaria CBS 119925 TaxID=1340428 RepID=A0A6A6VJB6_9PLEO|nr:ino eighty subunit 1 [Sporormia fimetaria CBS 119925]
MDATTPAPSAPPRTNDPPTNTKIRLQDILASEPDMDEDEKPAPSQRNTPTPEDQGGQGDGTDPSKSYYTATAMSTRRNANGTVSSVYAGNKMRHLKKEDGQPLWRKDIQYDFLSAVFHDDQHVFHKFSDGPGGKNLYTFADIYLDAMANSSKCSRILKEKLLTDRPAALNMAMVCLLVNMGRMNTTLNFFPEMRAQLRTYHSIPSLQAHQDPNSYKQLQDAPRLKSILKGAMEDTDQPSSIEDIKAASIPRTNPVNLVFVLSQYAPKISEIHFFPPRDFFDLVMRPNIGSKSRATAFLWLMWWYLESNFTEDDALNNPFGKGLYGGPNDTETGGLPVKCPAFDFLTPDQEALENVDTEAEKEFGERKRLERKEIMANDMAPVVTGPKRNGKKAAAFNQNPVFSVLADDGTSTPGRDRQSPSHGSGRGRGKLAKSIMERDYPSDTDRTRSASPPGSVYNTGKKSTPNMRINTLLNEDAPSSSPAPKGPGRGNWSRSRLGASGPRFKAKLDNPQDSQSPSVNPSVSTYTGPHGFYLPLNGSDPSHKRTRPLTAHQVAVEQYRRQRVAVILDRGLRKEFKQARRRRRAAAAEGTDPFTRAWMRCKGISDGWDTDEESNIQVTQQAEAVDGNQGRGSMPPPMFAGLLPVNYAGEVNDYGEEAYYRAKMCTRALRRLERWDAGPPVVGVGVGGGERTRNGLERRGSGGAGTRDVEMRERDEDSEGEGDEGYDRWSEESE